VAPFDAKKKVKKLKLKSKKQTSHDSYQSFASQGKEGIIRCADSGTLPLASHPTAVGQSLPDVELSGLKDKSRVCDEEWHERAFEKQVQQLTKLTKRHQILRCNKSSAQGMFSES
jgi:hypothetical protein